MKEKGNYTLLGTPLYMAPELLIEEDYNSKCDVWSLAFVFYEMLFGKTPWTGESPVALYKAIQEKPLSFDQESPISDDSRDFLIKCLQMDDNKRLDWEQVFKHKLIGIK
jgi:serine/threonine protein kinase